MTKEDALETWLPVVEMAIVDANIPEAKEALEMAFKALEQEPTEDAVSRQMVNELVDELARAISDERICISRGRSTATIMRDIRHLPSVTPAEKTGHWEFKQRGKYIDICCSKCGFQRIKEYAYNYTVDQISEQDMKDFFSNSNMNFCENCGYRMVKS